MNAAFQAVGILQRFLNATSEHLLYPLGNKHSVYCIKERNITVCKQVMNFTSITCLHDLDL